MAALAIAPSSGTSSEADLIARIVGGQPPGARARLYAERITAIPLSRRRGLGARGLVSEHGIPAHAAMRLAAVWELFDRWQPDNRPAIESPRDALLLLDGLRSAPREQVVVIMLDARHRLLATEVVAVGGLNAARLLPRDVMGPPLRADAAAVLVAHNHPSGDPSPSRADRLVTAALRSAGQMLGVPVLDHLIVAGSRSHSFREEEGWDAC